MVMIAPNMTRLLIILYLANFVYATEDRFIGCYKEQHSKRNFHLPQHTSREQCLQECDQKFYRYSLFKNEGFCMCTNYLGEEVNSNETCSDYCVSCELKPQLIDVYATGNLVPGPPRNIRIYNITKNALRISWEAPESYTVITSYQVKATVLHTYFSYVTFSPEWRYSNDTFQAELVTLLPATDYNITIRAIAPEGLGAASFSTTQTKIGDFETVPPSPKILEKEDNKITIQIVPISNNNGPVTSYLVVVINASAKQIFEEWRLASFNESRRDRVTYYIAAEIQASAVNKKFVVGDGMSYGKYFNAPLQPNVEYEIIIGAVSSLNGDIKRVFSIAETSLKKILTGSDNGNEISEDSPALIIGLSIAVGLFTFILIAGIIGFLILKSRVTNRRQRLSDNQELTIQGPMIEVENNGYIPEEEYSKVNHYKNLKQRLRSIPYEELRLEHSSVLGVGKFGRVSTCSMYETDILIPVAAYAIQDKKLQAESKKNMLKDLDVLIRAGKHQHIITLLGTTETPQMLFVLLEYVSMNLKDLLLGSRDNISGRFSNMSEIQALDIASNIARGMAHLHQNKIIHKQLCARNVMVAIGFIPKVSGYGLSDYHNQNHLPDYTRWTALEVFRGQSHNFKSDVWSFACLLWEICVLGGTPYGNFLNTEISDKIMKGLRLPQMQYFSDSLYQVMLNCWQIDMDERPYFTALLESLESLKEDTIIPHLDFSLHSNFQYEQFYPDMEVAVRSVF